MPIIGMAFIQKPEFFGVSTQGRKAMQNELPNNQVVITSKRLGGSLGAGAGP